MKRLILLSLVLLSLLSCNKEEEKINTEILPIAVDLFEGTYHESASQISLTWRYGSSSEISHFELFYSPGQDSVEKLNPWTGSYTLNPVSANKTYLFNIRAVDLYGTHSEARVVYIDTSEEE